MRKSLLILLLGALPASAQDEPNHPANMKSGQVAITLPPDTWLTIDVAEPSSKPPGYTESQINLYRNGAKVYERNSYNPKQSCKYLVKSGADKATYMLRGWTKSRPPDSAPPYHPWFPMPFREVRDPEKGTMVLTFDTDLKWNYFISVTTVKVRMYPGVLTQAEVQRLRNN
jgi:hypothetical protein